MPHNVLSILKSALAVIVLASIVTLAGMATFLVLSFNVRLPFIVCVKSFFVESVFTSTPVISNFAVGYFATSKKSGLFKCPSSLPFDSGSSARSLLFKELISIVKLPPLSAPSFTFSEPSLILKVPVCLPVGLLPVHVMVEVESTV